MNLRVCFCENNFTQQFIIIFIANNGCVRLVKVFAPYEHEILFVDNVKFNKFKANAEATTMSSVNYGIYTPVQAM